MLFLERRGKYIGDIDEVFGYTAIALIVLAIVALFASLLIFGGNSYNSDLEYNERVAEFNALPLTDRQTIANYTEYEVDENYLRAPVEVSESNAEIWHKVWLPALLIILAILSITTFAGYWYEKNRRYYLADLPLCRLYGWLLLLAMFVAWPFLLINASYAIIVNRPSIQRRLNDRRARCAERREKRQQEKQAVVEAAWQALTEEQLEHSVLLNFPEKARRVYIDYAVRGSQQAYLSRKSEAERTLQQCEERLRERGRAVKDAQRQLGEAKANLRNLDEAFLTGSSRTAAAADWEAIRAMRGVAKVTATKRRGKKTSKLHILVKVRVPYRHELYDFGDYQITLCGTDFSCKRVRSGVKINHTSTAPNYNESGGFCFGNRRSTIADYMQHGRILEAIALMIDCLHSVNSEHAEAEIPNCFRKVATIEHTKRRLMIQQRFGIIAKEGTR